MSVASSAQCVPTPATALALPWCSVPKKQTPVETLSIAQFKYSRLGLAIPLTTFSRSTRRGRATNRANEGGYVPATNSKGISRRCDPYRIKRISRRCDPYRTIKSINQSINQSFDQ